MVRSPGTASSRLLLSAFPLRLPHVAVEGETVYFGNLEDRRVSAEERAFLALADGRTSFGEILAAKPELMLAAGSTSYVLWLPLPAVAPVFPEAGETRLVISAHPGDVELSMGGFVARRSASHRFVHLVCFGAQLESRMPEAFGSRREVSAIRLDETHLAAAVLGIEARTLGLPEYVLRQTPDDDERMILPDEELEAALEIALYDVIGRLRPDHLYAPAAIGNHPDQRAIFDAVLSFYDQDSFPGLTYHLYENFPLSASYLHVDDFLSRFEDAYLALDERFEEITDLAERKTMLLEIFRSRFDRSILPLLAEVGERTARLDGAAASENGGGRQMERFWTVARARLETSETGP